MMSLCPFPQHASACRRLLGASVAVAWAGGWASSLAKEPPNKDVPWLDEIQSPVKQGAETQALPEIVDAVGGKIQNLEDWEVRRSEIQKWWLDFLGPLPGSRTAVPKLEVLAEDRVGEVIRQLVRYEIEPGLESEGYLLKPARNAGEKLPGVVVFHSTVNHSIRQPAGVQGRPEKAFALQLAQRGFVSFCPRNFLWPDNRRIAVQEQTARFQKRHPRTKGMGKMLHDGIVALNILGAQPEVDANRLGAVGHSLGAKEVLYLAAFDERVKVAVSSEGGIGTHFSNWEAPWYLGDTIKRADFEHEHHELLALAAPRPFLLIGGESADGDRSWPFIEAALPIHKLYTSGARLGFYNHRKGHGVPPEAEGRVYQWLETYL